MNYHLSDYKVDLGVVLIKCDNINVINLVKNMVLHSLTKHIKVSYQFIRDHVKKEDCVIEFVSSSNQLVNNSFL